MGNLLSFPLLCLQNYIAFRWETRGSDPFRSIPVLINGDDIVFRASRQVAQRWMRGVSALGLSLSVGKTLVNPSFFSLNSTFFRATDFGVKLIPVLRSAALFRPCDTPHAIAPGLRSYFRGAKGSAKLKSEILYLRWRRKEIAACGRSVLRDLRIPCSPEAVAAVGWGRREAFYLSLPPRPLSTDWLRLGTVSLPEGWRRVPVSRSRGTRRRQHASQKLFYELLLRQAWLGLNPTNRTLSRKVWRENTPGSLENWKWFSRHRRRGSRLWKSGLFRAGLSSSRHFVCNLSLLWSFQEPRAGGPKVWAGVAPGAMREWIAFVPPQ